MAPVLYYLEASPPVRSVLLVARAIGLELELRNVDLFKNEHLEESYLEMNPQHTVPTLNDDGFIVWDSHAISAYLVAKYAKNDSLYPKDLQKRAIVDQRLHFDSGILFPRLRNIFFPLLFLGRKNIPQANTEAMYEGYTFADAFLKDKTYCCGEDLTIADLCIVATLSTIIPVVEYEPEQLPNLTRWLNTMKKLPYYEEVNGKPATEIAKHVNTIVGK